MSSQKELAIVTPSAQGGLHLKDIDVPANPGPGQILLKVVAAGLNPLDYKMHDLGVLIYGYPTICRKNAKKLIRECGCIW